MTATPDILTDYNAELTDEQYALADRIGALLRPSWQRTPTDITNCLRSTVEWADAAAIEATDLVLRWMAIHRFAASATDGNGVVRYFARY